MKRRTRYLSLDRWLVLAITLLAFGLRAPFVEVRTLTIDEASSLKRAADHTFGYLLTHYHTNSHQLISLMARLLDYLGHWLTFYRGPSLVFGVLIAPLLYQLGRRMLGRKAGLLAALLLAAAPFHVDFSIQMRGYAVMAFWATLSYYCIWQGLSRPGWRYWIGLAIASILAVYAHLFGALAIGAGWLILGGTFFQDARGRKSSVDTGVEALAGNPNSSRPPWAKQALLSLLLTIVGLALLYGPIITRIVATPEEEKDWPTQIEALFVENGFNMDAVEDYLKVFRLYGPMGEPRSWLVWSFVLLAGFGAVSALARRETRRAGVYILIWIFVPILGVIVALQFVTGFYAYRRFFIFFQPLYLLLMAYGMLNLGQLAGRWSRRRALEYGVAGLLAAAALGSAGWKLNEQTPEDIDNRWYLAAQTILAQGKNPAVICEPLGDRMKERATHRDECYRNLEFYLAADLGDTPTWLHREVDQFASLPGLVGRPEMAEESGQVWLVLWQREFSEVLRSSPELPLSAESGITWYAVGSTTLIQTPTQATKLLALADLVDALLQIETTPEDRFSYLLSQAQMQAIIGQRDKAKQALLAAQELSPDGIGAGNRLKSVAELIGVDLDE